MLTDLYADALANVSTSSSVLVQAQVLLVCASLKTLCRLNTMLSCRTCH